MYLHNFKNIPQYCIVCVLINSEIYLIFWLVWSLGNSTQTEPVLITITKTSFLYEGREDKLQWWSAVIKQLLACAWPQNRDGCNYTHVFYYTSLKLHGASSSFHFLWLRHALKHPRRVYVTICACLYGFYLIYNNKYETNDSVFRPNSLASLRHSSQESAAFGSSAHSFNFYRTLCGGYNVVMTHITNRREKERKNIDDTDVRRNLFLPSGFCTWYCRSASVMRSISNVSLVTLEIKWKLM